MSSPHRDEPEQEISIRRREHELFRQADELSGGPTRSFAEYLRDTPSAPLSTGVKAVLWALAVVVALLFAAALWRSISRTHARPPRRPKPTPAASASPNPGPRPVARTAPAPRSNRPTRLPPSPNLES